MKKQIIIAITGLLLTTNLSGCSFFKRSFNWASNGFSGTPTPDPNQPNNNYPYYYSSVAAPTAAIDANERSAYASPYTSPLPPAAPGAIQTPSYNTAQPVTGGYASGGYTSGGYGVNPTGKTAKVMNNVAGAQGVITNPAPTNLPPLMQPQQPAPRPEIPMIAPAYPQAMAPAPIPAPQAYAPQPPMMVQPAPVAQPAPQTLMTFEQWQQLQQQQYQGFHQGGQVGQYQYPPAK